MITIRCSGMFRNVPCSWFYRRPVKTVQKWAVDKTRNMEHPGTFQNIPEHRIIMIIMKKICKIKFSNNELNKNKLVSAWEIKNKTKT